MTRFKTKVIVILSCCNLHTSVYTGKCVLKCTQMNHALIHFQCAHCVDARIPNNKKCSCRYGSCVPYQPIPFCDEFYEPDLDYVYIPSNRSDGSLSELIKHITDYGDLLLIRLKSCREIAIRVLCHYYLPPCGRGKQFQPPTAVCSEQCRAISQQCPEEWDGVVQQFDIYSAVIEETQLQLIDCDNPGEHLAPLSHCCSDLGLNTCKWLW